MEGYNAGKDMADVQSRLDKHSGVIDHNAEVLANLIAVVNHNADITNANRRRARGAANLNGLVALGALLLAGAAYEKASRNSDRLLDVEREVEKHARQLRAQRVALSKESYEEAWASLNKGEDESDDRPRVTVVGPTVTVGPNGSVRRHTAG